MFFYTVFLSLQKMRKVASIVFAVTKSRKLKQGKGLTLLEVLISISLICTCMIAFAAVFPASFRMTRKTSQANQACAYAAAVAEELRSMLVGKPTNSMYSQYTGKYLEEFCENSDKSVPTALTATTMGYLRFPKVNIPEPFTLIAGNDPTLTGVVVYSSNKDNRTFWTISVTVYWKETDPKGFVQQRSSTIVSAKSANVIRT